MRRPAQAIAIGGFTTRGPSGLPQDSDVFRATRRRPKPLQGHRTNRHVVAKAEPKLRNLHLRRGFHRFSSGALRQAYRSTRAGGTNSREISAMKRRTKHQQQPDTPYTGSLPNTRYLAIHSMTRMKTGAACSSSSTTSSTATCPARAIARADRPIRNGPARRTRCRETVARQPFHRSVPCSGASSCLHARLPVVQIADGARYSSANPHSATATAWLVATTTKSFARHLARERTLIYDSANPYWRRRSPPGHGIASSTPDIAARSCSSSGRRSFA